MSYCRFTDDSDVYMYPTHGVVECCLCALNDGHTLVLQTTQQAIEHLREHAADGDKVPQRAFERLETEAKLLPEYEERGLTIQDVIRDLDVPERN